MNDQNKKTLRQFQCRDYLWEIFEQMSAELECSVDYLINEAMRQYARSRNYGGARAPTPDPTTGQRAVRVERGDHLRSDHGRGEAVRGEAVRGEGGRGEGGRG